MTGPVTDVPASWPVVSSSPVYRGAIISVRRDTVRFPEGNTAEREVVSHPGAVGIVAVDEPAAGLAILADHPYTI